MVLRKRKEEEATTTKNDPWGLSTDEEELDIVKCRSVGISCNIFVKRWEGEGGGEDYCKI